MDEGSYVAFVNYLIRHLRLSKPHLFKNAHSMDKSMHGHREPFRKTYLIDGETRECTANEAVEFLEKELNSLRESEHYTGPQPKPEAESQSSNLFLVDDEDDSELFDMSEIKSFTGQGSETDGVSEEENLAAEET